jgi:hypothetical protein
MMYKERDNADEPLVIKKGEGGNIEVVQAASVAEVKPLAQIRDPDGWLCTACRDTDMEGLPSDLEEIKGHILTL